MLFNMALLLGCSCLIPTPMLLARDVEQFLKAKVSRAEEQVGGQDWEARREAFRRERVLVSDIYEQVAHYHEWHAHPIKSSWTHDRAPHGKAKWARALGLVYSTRGGFAHECYE